MLDSKEWANLMLVSIVIIISLLVTCCSSCPGSQNLVFPRFYEVTDFMKYDASERCILSKMDSYTRDKHGYFVAVLNGKDSFLFNMKNNSMVYFRLNHHGNSEDLRTLYWKYLRFFEKYSQEYYKYDGQALFKGNYLKWEYTVNLSSSSLQIVCKRSQASG